MKEKYLIMDVAKCHDCNNCYMSCLDEYAENDWPGYQAPMPRHGHRWMDILRRERGQNDRIDTAFLTKPCMQCGEAPCKEAGGFASSRDDGIVVFDPIEGKGKDIKDSCPYGSIWWNEEQQLSQKCDFCAHLLDDPSWEHAVPRCVHSCPTGALSFVCEEPSDFAKMAEAEGLSVYKAELGTKPHVWYKNLHRFTKDFIAGQLLKDGDVAPGVVVALTGENGFAAELESDMFGEFRFDGLDGGEYTLSVAGKELKKVTVGGHSVDAGDFDIG
ncbi:MAG: oxidoreductase [Clostridiales bacterium]|nr:oxidoreductase [Clostridiales bacterium]